MATTGRPTPRDTASSICCHDGAPNQRKSPARTCGSSGKLLRTRVTGLPRGAVGLEPALRDAREHVERVEILAGRDIDGLASEAALEIGDRDVFGGRLLMPVRAEVLMPDVVGRRARCLQPLHDFPLQQM